MDHNHVISQLIMSQYGVSGSEPWPDDTVLFHTNETEQSLIYDYANSLSVRAFLQMCDLPFTPEMRPNAEYMSPTGKLPFLKAGKAIVADFEPIVEFVSLKGIKLSETLNETEAADMFAHISLVQDVLLRAEMYICWLHIPTLREVTKPRYSSVYSWPLNYIVAYERQLEMQNRLRSFGWGDKTLEDVLAEVNEVCKTLSIKLGAQNYFAVDRPTELDALVFGHLFTVLTTELPDVDLASIVKQYSNLTDFCQRIEKDFFSGRRREIRNK